MAVQLLATEVLYRRQVQAEADATSSAFTAALALKADIASPTLTGTPAAPTAAPGTDNTIIATTAFVAAAVAAAGSGSGVSQGRAIATARNTFLP